jgi:hypothetical protein
MSPGSSIALLRWPTAPSRLDPPCFFNIVMFLFFCSLSLFVVFAVWRCLWWKFRNMGFGF